MFYVCVFSFLSIEENSIINKFPLSNFYTFTINIICNNQKKKKRMKD